MAASAIRGGSWNLWNRLMRKGTGPLALKTSVFSMFTLASCDPPKPPPQSSCKNPPPPTSLCSSCATTPTPTLTTTTTPPLPQPTRTPIDWLETDLSHKCLVRQACSLTVDGVTRILTETLSAYLSYHEKYRCALDALIEALEASRTAGGTALELLDCRLIMMRSEVDALKCKIAELESFLCSIQRLADAAAETAFLGHAEYSSLAMSERVMSVAREMEIIKEQSSRKERDAVELQSVVIVESGRGLK